MSTKITDLRRSMVRLFYRGSVWQSSGELWTKFSHGWLVECIFIFQFSWKSQFFENVRSGETLWIWRWHYLFYTLKHLCKSSIYSEQEIQSVFYDVLKQNIVNSKKSIGLPFSAGANPSSLAIVSVLLSEGEEHSRSTSHGNRAVNRQPSFRTYESNSASSPPHTIISSCIELRTSMFQEDI